MNMVYGMYKKMKTLRAFQHNASGKKATRIERAMNICVGKGVLTDEEARKVLEAVCCYSYRKRGWSGLFRK